MNLKQFNNQIEKAAHRYYVSTRKLLDKISAVDKKKYLIEYGWEPYSKKEVLDGFWKCKRLGTFGVSLYYAYKAEYKYQQELKRKEEIKNHTAKVICNCCGTNLAKYDKDIDRKKFCLGYYGLVNAHVSGGYNSDYLKDTLTYTFSVCEKCLVKWFSTFKKIPAISIYL